MGRNEMFIKKQVKLTGHAAHQVALRHNVEGVTPYVKECPSVVLVLERTYRRNKLTNQETMMFERVLRCS